MRFRESRRPVLFIRVMHFGILQEHTLNTFMRSQDSSVDIVTRLRAGQSGNQIAAKARCFLLKMSTPVRGPYHSPVQYVRVILTTHLLSPTTRLSGSLQLLPLLAFMAGTGTTLLFNTFMDPCSVACYGIYSLNFYM